MQRQAVSRAELQASIAALAEEWAEQTRSLHFVFRDLGSEAGCFGWSSPFEGAPGCTQRAKARVSARLEGAVETKARVVPLGAVRV